MSEGTLRVCTVCGTVFRGEFCPGCGEGPTVRALRQKAEKTGYAEYLAFYPDKSAAIRALRRKTGMGFIPASNIVNALFTGTEIPVPADTSEEKEENERVRTEKTRKAMKKVAKGTAVAAGLTAYSAFRVVKGLVEKYK